MTVAIIVLAGLIFVVFGVGASIALHEAGHLIPAKWAGVKVKQYMIGFGPTIWSRRRGETEYGVKAIPLGGYVRMIGMFPPKPDEDPARLRASSTGRFSQLADQARADAMEEIEPGDEDRVFYKLPTHKKLVVMLGGPMMNLVLAALLLTSYITLYGVLDPSKPLGAKVAGVNQCVVTDPLAVPDGQDVDCSSHPVGPAYAAGIRPGDRIVSIAGQPVQTSTDIARLVRPAAGRPLPIVVDRGDSEITLTVTPTTGKLAKLDANGEPVLGADGTPVTESVGYMGTTTRPVYGLTRLSVTEAPGYVWNAFTATAGVVIRIPEKMVGVWQAVFSDERRDVNGPVSVIGTGRLVGEKASGVQTGSILDDIDLVPFTVQILAMLNMALFAFNLIPLMPLDGGQVAGAVWEWLRRRFAQLTGRPDPGPVDVAKALPLAYAMSIVLIGMSVLLMYADLVKPIRF